MAYVQQFNEPIIGERSTLLDSLSGKSGTVYQSDISTDMWMLLIACSQTLGIKTPAATPNMKKESKRIAEQFSLGRLDNPFATDIKDTAERIDAFANTHIVNRHF